MIIANSRLAHGTHSAAAIFHLARKEPVLSHAVRSAPRVWWTEIARELGHQYVCIWIDRPLPGDPNYIPGWIVEPYAGRREFDKGIRRAKEDGFIVKTIPLCFLGEAYHAAASTFGLVCRRCGEPTKTEFFAADFLCGYCLRRARSLGRASSKPGMFRPFSLERGLALLLEKDSIDARRRAKRLTDA